MFRVAVGHSNDLTEVLQQCWHTLGTDFPIAGILFVAADFEPDLINIEFQLSKSCRSQVLPSCVFDTHGEPPLKNNAPSRLHHDTFVTLLLGAR